MRAGTEERVRLTSGRSDFLDVNHLHPPTDAQDVNAGPATLSTHPCLSTTLANSVRAKDAQTCLQQQKAVSLGTRLALPENCFDRSIR